MVFFDVAFRSAFCSRYKEDAMWRKSKGHPAAMALHALARQYDDICELLCHGFLVESGMAYWSTLYILKTYLSIRFFLRGMGLQTVLGKVAAQIIRTDRICACDVVEVEALCRKIRQTGLYLPFRTACLESALVCAVLLSRRSIPVQLRIGIQLDPFLAHAWINVEGRVILDKPDLNQSMIPLVDIK